MKQSQKSIIFIAIAIAIAITITNYITFSNYDNDQLQTCMNSLQKKVDTYNRFKKALAQNN
jgi:hypothetical protein